METDFPSPEHSTTTYVYDPAGGFPDRHKGEVAVLRVSYRDTAVVGPTPVAFEHDKKKRLFTVTGPDGKIEQFRDNPTRYLIVEPDPETGALRPVIKCGKQAYLYLCREEREP
jgi:hypothetical protein